jgi:hypothetical protein
MVSGSHYVSKARFWNLRAFGPQASGLSNSHCQSFAQTQPDSSHPNDRQTEQDNPDFQNTTSEGIRFHVPTLALHRRGCESEILADSLM